MKKVFRIWKMLENDLDNNKNNKKLLLEAIRGSVLSLQCKWPFQCEGKTLEECKGLGYQIFSEWLVEEDE